MNKSTSNSKLKVLTRKNKAKRVLAVVALGLSISPMALAAKTLDDVVASIQTFQTSLVGQVLTPLISYYKQLVEAIDTTWAPAASLANTSGKTTKLGSFVRDQVDQKTLQKTAQILTQQDAAKQFTGLAALPASDTEPNKITATQTWNDDDRRLYIDSLLGKDSYDQTTDQNNAEEAVVFLSDYSSPLGSIDISTLTPDQINKMNTSPQGQQYRVHIRGVAAIRSLVVNNFYHMLMARTPVKNLGKNAGLPGSSDAGKTDASPLQVERYIATRRLEDPDWYTAMNKAPAIVVARETLFVLAEMEKQLFEIQRQNDRILATLTASVVTGLNASKIIPDQNENDLRQLLGLDPVGPAASASQALTSANAKNTDTTANSSNATSTLNPGGVTPPTAPTTTTSSK